jgi:hypothetical protein
MNRPTRDDRIAALEAGLPPEFQDFARWLAVDLVDELTGKVVTIGLPPELARAVAEEAVTAIADKVERAAVLFAKTRGVLDVRTTRH